ncbi:unnamed protein product, partial [Mesorhabditis spiculigera]
MAVNFSHICLTEKQQMVHGTELEYNLQRYVYPAIAIFGILGNALNLTVLLNRNMRSRANCFLAVLAFADIIFLSLVLPNVLANYGAFVFNYYFRWFYFTTKMHIISLANWSSAVAIWCIISVCADRLWGIRNPLYARDPWPWWKMPLVMSTIVVGTGVCTLYQHFEYNCPLRDYCNGTQIFSRCQAITNERMFGRPNPYPEAWRNLISFCVTLYPLVMIICPIILLAVLNLLLICALRRRQHNLMLGGHAPDSRKRSTEVNSFAKTEHRVTLTVTFIVTMFTITNGPSALEHLVRKTFSQDDMTLYYDINMICTTLVIFGKASNFILFCLGSKHFRLRLIKLTQKKMNKKIENFSSTFLDRTSLRRSSGPLMKKRSSTMNESCNTSENSQESSKKRLPSRASLNLRPLTLVDNRTGPSRAVPFVPPTERFTPYEDGSEPLIHTNSNTERE